MQNGNRLWRAEAVVTASSDLQETAVWSGAVSISPPGAFYAVRSLTVQSDHEVGFSWDAMIGCPGEFYLSTEYLHEWKDVWEKLAAVIACDVLLPTDCINEFYLYKLLQRADQARNQTYPKGGSYSSPLPFPLSLPPFPSTSPPLPILPLPPFPLELGPLNPARGLGERCKLPQRGLGRSPSRNQIRCILALKSDVL